MNLQQQVTSLEISKKLKELGVKQKSLLSWYDRNKDNNWAITDDEMGNWGTQISAFTVAELGEMLPMYSSSEKHSNEWRVGIVKEGERNQMAAGNTEANARGKMLIYLLENKLIKL